jgi:hypothetical protein
MDKGMTADSPTGDSRILGMTRSEIVAAADVLSQQKDQNHPTKTGSYQGLIDSVRKGREILSRQNGYCRKKP